MSIRRVKSIHCFAGPLGGRGWPCDLTVDVAIHVARLRHRRVVVDDDLGVRIDLLQLANEGKGLTSVPFWVARVADDEGELRNDAELLVRSAIVTV